MAGAAALACFAWLGGAIALADDDGATHRIVLLRFRGSHADVIRASASEALEDVPTLQVVPVRTLEAERGLTGDAGARAAELARRLSLTALLRGRVKRAAGGLRVKVSVVNGQDGEVLGDVTIVGRTSLALHKKLRSQLWRRLRPLVERAMSPVAAPARVADRRTEEPSEENPEPRAPAHEPPPMPRATELPPPRAPLAENSQARAPGSDGAERAEGDESGQAGDDADEDQPETAPSPPRAPTVAARGDCPRVEVDAAGGALFRAYDYRNEHEGALRGYYMLGDPVVRGDVTAYPFSSGPCTFLSGLGIRAGGEWTRSRPARLEDQRFTTVAFAYHAEIVLAIPAGRFTFKPSAGYFDRTYRVNGDPFPSIDARAVGAGVDVEARFGAVFIGVAGGGRFILSTGPLGSATWFPGATARGLVGQARLGIALNDRLALFAAGAIELDFYDLHPTVGRRYQNGIADGASDQYLHAVAGLRLRF